MRKRRCRTEMQDERTEKHTTSEVPDLASAAYYTPKSKCRSRRCTSTPSSTPGEKPDVCWKFDSPVTFSQLTQISADKDANKLDLKEMLRGCTFGQKVNKTEESPPLLSIFEIAARDFTSVPSETRKKNRRRRHNEDKPSSKELLQNMRLWFSEHQKCLQNKDFDDSNSSLNTSSELLETPEMGGINTYDWTDDEESLLIQATQSVEDQLYPEPKIKSEFAGEKKEPHSHGDDGQKSGTILSGTGRSLPRPDQSITGVEEEPSKSGICCNSYSSQFSSAAISTKQTKPAWKANDFTVVKEKPSLANWRGKSCAKTCGFVDKTSGSGKFGSSKSVIKEEVQAGLQNSEAKNGQTLSPEQLDSTAFDDAEDFEISDAILEDFASKSYNLKSQFHTETAMSARQSSKGSILEVKGRVHDIGNLNTFGKNPGKTAKLDEKIVCRGRNKTSFSNPKSAIKCELSSTIPNVSAGKQFSCKLGSGTAATDGILGKPQQQTFHAPNTDKPVTNPGASQIYSKAEIEAKRANALKRKNSRRK